MKKETAFADVWAFDKISPSKKIQFITEWHVLYLLRFSQLKQKKKPNQQHHNNKMVTPGDTSRLIVSKIFLRWKNVQSIL